MRSQRQDHFLNLKQRKDREVSVHTTYTGRSQSQSGSHISHEENIKAMQLEIDHLRRRLHCERRRRTPSGPDFLLTMVGMAATSLGQGLPSVSLSSVMRIAIASAEVRAHLAEA